MFHIYERKSVWLVSPPPSPTVHPLHPAPYPAICQPTARPRHKNIDKYCCLSRLLTTNIRILLLQYIIIKGKYLKKKKKKICYGQKNHTCFLLTFWLLTVSLHPHKLIEKRKSLLFLWIYYDDMFSTITYIFRKVKVFFLFFSKLDNYRIHSEKTFINKGSGT